MVDSKTLKKAYVFFVNFFKKENGDFDKCAITFSIINVVASFFFLNSVFNWALDLSNLGALFNMSLSVYLLFGILLSVFIILVIVLEQKYVRFNINIFLLLYFIFQLPTINSLTAVFFIVVAIALYLYPYRQLHEIDYVKKINIRRRVTVGLYLIILVSSLALSMTATQAFSKYSIDDVVTKVFIDDGTVKSYIRGVYNKYLSTPEFYATLDDMELQISETPEQILKAVNDLPPNVLELMNLTQPDALVLLKSDATKESLKVIKGQVLSMITELKNFDRRDILIDRIINIGVGQVKSLIMPYELYIRFYFGYSIFAVLVILSPFLLVLISWLAELMYYILLKGNVLKVVKVKEEVEVITRA